MKFSISKGLFAFAISLVFCNSVLAQAEDLKQRSEAFVDAMSKDYKKKYLNISDRNIGLIDETNHIHSEKYMMQAKDKRENTVGRNTKFSYYINLYAYADEQDLNMAVAFWFKNFMEGESIRPGREKRVFDNATPTVVIINKNSIAVLNFSCNYFFEEEFNEWRERMISFFGDENSVVMDIGCGGPLKWTQNPPDFKDRKWR